MQEIRFRRLLTKWGGRTRPRKEIAPLALGAFDAAGRVGMNYDGELDDQLPVSAEHIEPGTRILCVVHSVEEYHGHVYGNITRVLVEVDQIELPETRSKRKTADAPGAEPARKMMKQENEV